MAFLFFSMNFCAFNRSEWSRCLSVRTLEKENEEKFKHNLIMQNAQNPNLLRLSRGIGWPFKLLRVFSNE